LKEYNETLLPESHNYKDMFIQKVKMEPEPILVKLKNEQPVENLGFFEKKK
jgi:hypothetical protein